MERQFYLDQSLKLTPQLKEGLGWKTAENGTFRMSDSDFFFYYTSVDVSLPHTPELYSRHYTVQLKLGDHDGYTFESAKAKIAYRPNFSFQVIGKLEKGERCRFHVLVEKHQKLYDGESGVLYQKLKYGVIVGHSNGKKLSLEVISNSN